MWFQRVEIDGDDLTREVRSLWDRKADFNINITMFSKEGSVMKEWFGDILPKDPGAVARTTDEG